MALMAERRGTCSQRVGWPVGWSPSLENVAAQHRTPERGRRGGLVAIEGAALGTMTKYEDLGRGRGRGGWGSGCGQVCMGQCSNTRGVRGVYPPPWDLRPMDMRGGGGEEGGPGPPSLLPQLLPMQAGGADQHPHPPTHSVVFSWPPLPTGPPPLHPLGSLWGSCGWSVYMWGAATTPPPTGPEQGTEHGP